MRGANHVGQAEQHVFSCGFFGEYIKRRTGDMAGFQQLGQRGLVHQTTTGAVDDAHALFGFRQIFSRQDVAGAIGQRHMQGDEIGAGQQLVQLDLFNAHFGGFFFAQVGVERDDLHFQAQGAVANDAADIARTDHAKGFGGQFGAHEFGLFPFACMG